MLTRITRSVAVLALALAASAGSARAEQVDKVVLLLNWYNYGEHAPFYLGVAKGLYAKENLDVDIQEGRGSGITIQAVAAGSVQFGYADVGTMMKIAAKGAPVEAMGVLLQRSPMSIMGFAEKNITKPSDIVGKTVALSPGDSLTPIFPVYLKKNGISESQFKAITGDATTKRNAVVNGQADLLLGNVNDQKVIIEDGTGKPMRALLFADGGVNPVNAGIIVSKSLMKSNPELIRRFMRASTAAVEATERAPDEAVSAMLAVNPKAGKREVLKSSLDLTLPLYHTEATKGQKPFRVDPADVASTLDLMVQYGGMDAATAGKPGDYVTLELLP
jgi:NitT/TauT family transport system substrate-binding protein